MLSCNIWYPFSQQFINIINVYIILKEYRISYVQANDRIALVIGTLYKIVDDIFIKQAINIFTVVPLLHIHYKC